MVTVTISDAGSFDTLIAAARKSAARVVRSAASGVTKTRNSGLGDVAEKGVKAYHTGEVRRIRARYIENARLSGDRLRTLERVFVNAEGEIMDL